MPLRVIAGSARGRKLKLVPGDSTRPIMDRVKEALFSIIGYAIRDTIFLDLFAGTGSVGIEALSRGAAQAVFLDLDKAAIRTIYDNLTITGFTERAVVRRADAFALLKGAPDREYDFIFIAPPQYQDMWKRALEALDANPAWIPDGTTVIVQIDPQEYQPLPLKHLELTDERRYGKTMLCFYMGRDEAAAADESVDEAANR
jgi:16S rRNA (guanine(966)-N(2))-methyltransferase RsmD